MAAGKHHQDEYFFNPKTVMEFGAGNDGGIVSYGRNRKYFLNVIFRIKIGKKCDQLNRLKLPVHLYSVPAKNLAGGFLIDG